VDCRPGLLVAAAKVAPKLGEHQAASPAQRTKYSLTVREPRWDSRLGGSLRCGKAGDLSKACGAVWRRVSACIFTETLGRVSRASQLCAEKVRASRGWVWF